MVVIESLPTDKSLQRFTSMLVKLHKLIWQGRGDGDEADQLRDLMDVPWFGLSEHEAKIARQVSSDLYTLDPDTQTLHSKLDVFTSELSNDLNVARHNEDWLQALQLLSSRAPEIGVERATSLRGSCYQHLGLPDIAMLFFERAVDLSPAPSGALIFLLTNLVGSGRRHTAAERARAILSQGALDVELHRLCALVLLGDATDDRNSISTAGINEAQTEFESVLKTLQSSNRTDERTIQSVVECYFSLAECAYLLGDERKAIQNLGTALRISPNDEPSLVFRGLLNLDKFPLARDDFRRAIEVGTDDAWPYYYLTHDLFRSEKYDSCVHLAWEGLKRTRKPELAGEFHEILAMSLFMTSRNLEQKPIDEIRRHFLLAIAQSPLNLNASENFHRFESFNINSGKPEWQLQKPWAPAALDFRRALVTRFQTDPLLAN